ncbi:MAG: hypothetical protein NC081_09745 [Roseburia sp.]|nr:hypothetical protein [Roseburia sp.]
MKSQEAEVYRKIQENTDTAIKALDTLSDKVYDDQLAMQISSQSLKYSELHNRASKQLVAAKAESYRPNALSELALRSGLHYNTLLNTSTGHIAELMIKSSNDSILKMEKSLNHNHEAGESCVELARQLIGLEEESIKRLKDYL